ncbi:unnamed protein product [Ectocarpus sp. 12 AP-2014]
MDFIALQDCIKEEVIKGVSQGIEDYNKREVQRISEEHHASKGGDTSPTGLPAGSREAATHTSVPAVIPGMTADTPRNSPAASPSDGVVDALARAITAGLSIQHQYHHEGRVGAGMLRLTPQGLELCVEPWTGVIEREEDVQTRFLVFKSTLLAIFAQEGLTDVVIREVPIRVGPSTTGGDDLDSLREKFSEDLMERSTKAWNILISSITYMPILTQILAAGSPSEGWKIFCTYYERRAAREKSRLEDEYREFRMESNESPQSYFDRFAVLRGRLACFGVTFPDPQRHLVRNLAPAFNVIKEILLSQELTIESVEDVVTDAYEHGDVQIQREEDDQDGAGYDPVASGSGRDGGSVQNGGRWNNSGFRRRIRGPGPGRGHEYHQGWRGHGGLSRRGQPRSWGGVKHAEHGQPPPPRPPSYGQQQPWLQAISAHQFSSTATVTQRTFSAPRYGGDAEEHYSNSHIDNGHPYGYYAYPPHENTTHGTSNYDY